MKLIERDVSVSKKFDQFFDLRGSFFAKWIFKIPIFTQKLGHVWHIKNCYIFMEIFSSFFLFFSSKLYLSNECKIIMLG
jgi:hypothetical protein